MDLNQPQSQMITEDLINSFQLLLVMEKWPQQFILHLSPNISERALILSQVLGIEKDMIDPVGRSKDNDRNIIKDLTLF